MIRSQTIIKRLAPFKDWLNARGAQLLESTNEWEIIRFKSGDETCVIYRKKSGSATFTGSAHEAWEAFRTSRKWRASPRTNRKRHSRKSAVVISLFKRDGNLCFFCQKYLGNDFTIEHLISLTHGGPDHTSNMVLAHEECNIEAGHISVMAKINIHVNAQQNR